MTITTEPYNKQTKKFREGREEYITTKDTKPTLVHGFYIIFYFLIKLL
jgi:hypothetical protein